MADDRPDDIAVSLTLDTSQFKLAMGDADRLSKGFASSLSNAFTGLAVKGRSLGDVFSELALRLSRLALTSALKPLEQSFAKLFEPLGQGLLGGLGAAGSQGATGPPQSILPFARGGVVASPTYFPLGQGLGMAGERGAEAILPLARGADGSLGVRAAGGGGGAPMQVTVNIATPDVEGFRRSQTEVAASLARLVGRGQRGL